MDGTSSYCCALKGFTKKNAWHKQKNHTALWSDTLSETSHFRR